MVTERTFESRIKNGKRERFARRLRSEQTDAESIFWYNVRGRRLAGFKFRRQRVIGPYIVDFICREARLIVELDGGQHASRADYDRRRDEYLGLLGFRVLRIWNNDLITNRNGVMETVLRSLREVATPSPWPSPSKGRGELD